VPGCHLSVINSELLNSLDPRQLGERLKDARKARGLTQDPVASKLGILRTTLVAIEKGERRVTRLCCEKQLFQETSRALPVRRV